MTGPFIHEHPQFQALLSIISQRLDISTALVEKDYWVTHSLWAITESGLRVCFKGGTSLSKGFSLIDRFSEDLDVMIQAADLPQVMNWTSDGTRATKDREHFFHCLRARLKVPGAEVTELAEIRDPNWRNVVFAVTYPSQLSNHLPIGVHPFVQVEVGWARVTPGENRPITSWVHDHLGQVPDVARTVLDNRPHSIHCVRPDVTALEKIEAISRRYRRAAFEPASFVRHYEDVARILASPYMTSVESLRSLLAEMMSTGDIKDWPGASDLAFAPELDQQRWERLEKAWTAIGPLFWGERIPAQDCASRIRVLLRSLASPV